MYALSSIMVSIKLASLHGLALQIAIMHLTHDSFEIMAQNDLCPALEDIVGHLPGLKKHCWELWEWLI